MASIMVNLFTLSLPLMTMVIYQSVLPASASNTLITLSIGVVFIIIFDLLFNDFRTRRIMASQIEADRTLARTLFKRVAKAKLDGQVTNGSALLSAIRDFDQARSALASGFITVLVDIPFALLFLGLLLYISIPIGLVTLTGSLIILSFGLYAAYKSSKLHKSLSEASAERHKVLVDTVRDFTQARWVGWIDRLIGAHDPAADRLANASAQMQLAQTKAMQINKTLIQSVQTVTAMIGAWEVMNESINVAALIGFSMLAARTAGMVGQIAQTLPRWVMAEHALKNVGESLNLPQQFDEGRDYATELPDDRNIHMEEVEFTYPSMPAPAINGVNLSIADGEMTALMGPSGAGKTTILALASGLYDPDRGRIRLGGIDLDHIDPDILGQRIGVVPSEPVLFGETLAEWLTARGASLDKASEMIDELGLGTVIQEHPYGIYRPLTGGGKGLSAGQKKGIALARAFLDDAPILILDDPSEGMDSETRKKVLAALKKYTSGKSVLVSSHDDQVLQMASYLALLNKGRVVLSGPAAEVRQRLYRNAQSNQPS